MKRKLKRGEESSKKLNPEPEAKSIPEMLRAETCNLPPHFLSLRAFNTICPAELSLGFPVDSASSRPNYLSTKADP